MKAIYCVLMFNIAKGLHYRVETIGLLDKYIYNSKTWLKSTDCECCVTRKSSNKDQDQFFIAVFLHVMYFFILKRDCLTRFCKRA